MTTPPPVHTDFLRTLKSGRRLFNTVDIGLVATQATGGGYGVLSLRVTLGNTKQRRADIVFRDDAWFAVRAERDAPAFDALLSQTYRGQQLEFEGIPAACRFVAPPAPAGWFANAVGVRGDGIWHQRSLRYEVGGSDGRLFDTYDGYQAWVNSIEIRADLHDRQDLVARLALRQPLSQYDHTRQFSFELEYPLYLGRHEVTDSATRVHFFTPHRASSWRMKWKSEQGSGQEHALDDGDGSVCLTVVGHHAHLELNALFDKLSIGPYHSRITPELIGPIERPKPRVGSSSDVLREAARVPDRVDERVALAANEQRDMSEGNVAQDSVPRRGGDPVAVRRRLLQELYNEYMESAAAYRNYDGRDPEASDRAREAEWLKARGYVKGPIGADDWLSLQLTPDGRDYFEAEHSADSSHTAQEFDRAITNGEDPSVVGSLEPQPLPQIVASTPDTLSEVVGEGVDVLLVTAASEERDAMLRHMIPVAGREYVIKAPAGDHVYFIGRLGDSLSALVMTRIGAAMRDGATLAVNEAIGVCNPRAVIAVGMAWGMNTQQLRLGDVLVSTQIVPFDVARRQDTGDLPRGAKPEAGGLLLNRFRNVTGWRFARADGYVCRIKDGPVLSGESLVDSLVFKSTLHAAFPDAIGGEMEGTGIYGASAKNRGEWIIVKAVCDWADGTKNKQAQPVATAASASLVAHVVAETGTLADLPRMGRVLRRGVAGSTGQVGRSARAGDVLEGDSWRVEKRATKRAEVAGEALVAALQFLDGLSSITSILVTSVSESSVGDADQRVAWRTEIEGRWARFAASSNRFVDALRLAEAYLSDEVNEVLNRVWLERASIKASHTTYFATPEPAAAEFFREGFGSAPERRLAGLRDECRKVLRPIAQLE